MTTGLGLMSAFDVLRKSGFVGFRRAWTPTHTPRQRWFYSPNVHEHFKFMDRYFPSSCEEVHDICIYVQMELPTSTSDTCCLGGMVKLKLFYCFEGMRFPRMFPQNFGDPPKKLWTYMIPPNSDSPRGYNLCSIVLTANYRFFLSLLAVWKIMVANWG